MMPKALLFFIALLWATIGLSQQTYTLRILDEESREPVVGATVQLLELKKGEISDQNGEVVFENLDSNTFTFLIRFLGYEELKFKRAFPLENPMETIHLHPAHEEMEAVMVTSTRSSRTIEDTPTRVEIIAGEELAEKGNMKPGDIRMLLNESTGIQTQQTSATSYNSSIRIQGLDGKYTQLLRDGLPLYAGYSGGLSLMQIPPLDLAQVEVVKGSSSTLYGGGAIAGLVNLISKRPTEERTLELMLNGTSALGMDASSFFAQQFGKWGTTVFVSFNQGTAYDPADIGLTAIPKFDRWTINPKFFWNPTQKSELMLGVNWAKEDRLGGNVDFIQGEQVEDPYFENNQTDRLSTQLTYSNTLREGVSLRVKNSLNFFDRQIQIPDYQFGGKQISSFSEIHLSKSGTKAEWVAGLNLWTENFTQNPSFQSIVLDYQLNTFGAFVQNLWNISSKWTVESGLRVDTQKDYGNFVLPKASVMFEPNELLTFRLGGGLGYKPPTVFTEETERLSYQNVLPIDPQLLEAERSKGFNLDVNQRWAIGEELTLSSNVLLFYTQIDNPLILRLTDGFYQYEQPSGKLRTQGAEVNMKWEYRDLKLFVGYTYADVDQRINQTESEYPLVAKHRLNNVLMYEKHENFRLGLEAYYFSPQLLNDGAMGKSYWIVGLMGEKYFGENFSLFLNFENFLDTRQTAFDTIFTGSISNPVFRDIYAPVDGFVINGGLKVSL
ncbi:MAG: TonB-dependent receptor [Cyclobacteriaceae bacterium]|nr:TonB-dependent receptor [Cyclobacteriaceae bacterium]MDX5467474.1 TonB-dependent receptor [Cyclobacteriaceae bacterium]